MNRFDKVILRTLTVGCRFIRQGDNKVLQITNITEGQNPEFHVKEDYNHKKKVFKNASLDKKVVFLRKK